MPKKMLSVVLPSFNEEQNIPLAYKELIDIMQDLQVNYELIFVNDGSKDGTWAAIEKITSKDKNVRGVNFSRNFGHHAALEAGLTMSRGDAVIMMDVDLQHPPSLIPELVAKWREGYDIVNTVRLSTEDISAGKRLTSKLFYKVLNNISDLELREGEADYRLVSRRALDTLNSLPETPKFYRGLINWVGYDTARVEYVAQARMHGKSSYTLKKMIELARLGLTSFSMKPLKLIIAIGLSLVAGAFVALMCMLIVKFGFHSEYFSNNAILIMFLVLVTGVLTTFQGIVAVYLVDIFNEAKGRPSYIVKDATNDQAS